MAYQIKYWVRAKKFLSRIPNSDRRRIAKAIDDLSHDPRPMGCEKMKGMEDSYRIRIGDYRVVYEIVDQVLVVYVIRVDHRKDVCRKR